MSTDVQAIRERIESVLEYYPNAGDVLVAVGFHNDRKLLLADNLRDLLAENVRLTVELAEARAGYWAGLKRAWDEGYDAGWCSCDGLGWHDNPYRAATEAP